jgi:hypothetical protein
MRTVKEYHQRTKHQVHRYARALWDLDWDTQPEKVRTYEGTGVIPLLEAEPTEEHRTG